MKSLILRPVILLVLALGLAACGGDGKAKFEVKGPIVGLEYDGLVLKNSGATLAVPAKATRYTFPGTIEYGTMYKVEIDKQPSYQTCQVAGGEDSAGHQATIEVGVQCAKNTYALGGTVKGLKAAGLLVANGSDSAGGSPVPVAPATDSFYAVAGVTFGTTYGLSIIAQPTGQTCSFDNPAKAIGQMQGVPVVDINITCVTP